MSMYKGFKKVKEDEKTATMKHPNGHEIKVAKAGLSPQLLKELTSLPLHKMADGGYVQPTTEVAKHFRDNSNVESAGPSGKAKAKVYNDVYNTPDKSGSIDRSGMAGISGSIDEVNADRQKTLNMNNAASEDNKAKPEFDSSGYTDVPKSYADGGDVQYESQEDGIAREQREWQEKQNQPEPEYETQDHTIKRAQQEWEENNLRKSVPNVNYARGGKVQRFANGTNDVMPSTADFDAQALKDYEKGMNPPDEDDHFGQMDKFAEKHSTPSINPKADVDTPEHIKLAEMNAASLNARKQPAARDPLDNPQFDPATGQKQAPAQPDMPDVPDDGDDENSNTPAVEDTNPAMAAKIHQPDTYGNPNQLAQAPQQAAPQAPAGYQGQYDKAYNEYKLAHAQQFAQEDVDYQQDWTNGHITPETMHSIYQNKSPWGKAGMLFGLLLSGAGSGLAHQPNAALDLMQKEINNNLEAQKSSKVNAQQRKFQDAQIARFAVENGLTLAQTKQVSLMRDIQQDTFQRQRANRDLLHQLNKDVNNMKLSPQQRADAANKLAIMGNLVDAQNYNLGDTAAAKMAALQAQGLDAGGNPTGAQQSGGSESGDIAMRLRGMKVRGFIDENQYAKANDELKLIENKEQANSGALDSFDKVAQMSTSGYKIKNPIQAQKQIDAEWDPMLDKLTKSNEGRVTPITVEMMNALKPALTDNKETTAIKRQKLNEILNSGYSTPVLEGLRLTHKRQAPTSSQTKMMNGVQYTKVPGGWKKVR